LAPQLIKHRAERGRGRDFPWWICGGVIRNRTIKFLKDAGVLRRVFWAGPPTFLMRSRNYPETDPRARD